MGAAEVNPGNKFVRPASAQHAALLAQLQASGMKQVLEAEFPRSGLADQISAAALQPVWERTLEIPADSNNAVLVATNDDAAVGFVAFGQPADMPETEEGDFREILALEVADEARQSGHASRLLAAVADMVGRDSGTELRVWLVPAEEQKIRFFQSAGFAPSGIRRSLDVAGNNLIQHLWVAVLLAEPTGEATLS